MIIQNNPLHTLFKRGLNVSLSTDDPLQFHFTEQPLLEEYAVASQFWKLSPCDVSEIARNSVTQSGFSHKTKQQWIGDHYQELGIQANDVRKTNIPNIRADFRNQTWNREMKLLSTVISLSSDHKSCSATILGESDVFPRLQIKSVKTRTSKEIQTSSAQLLKALHKREDYLKGFLGLSNSSANILTSSVPLPDISHLKKN